MLHMSIPHADEATSPLRPLRPPNGQLQQHQHGTAAGRGEVSSRLCREGQRGAAGWWLRLQSRRVPLSGACWPVAGLLLVCGCHTHLHAHPNFSRMLHPQGHLDGTEAQGGVAGTSGAAPSPPRQQAEAEGQQHATAAGRGEVSSRLWLEGQRGAAGWWLREQSRSVPLSGACWPVAGLLLVCGCHTHLHAHPNFSRMLHPQGHLDGTEAQGGVAGASGAAPSPPRQQAEAEGQQQPQHQHATAAGRGEVSSWLWVCFWLRPYLLPTISSTVCLAPEMHVGQCQCFSHNSVGTFLHRPCLLLCDCDPLAASWPEASTAAGCIAVFRGRGASSDNQCWWAAQAGAHIDIKGCCHSAHFRVSFPAAAPAHTCLRHLACACQHPPWPLLGRKRGSLPSCVVSKGAVQVWCGLASGRQVHHVARWPFRAGIAGCHASI
jgi:hypothetical protein